MCNPGSLCSLLVNNMVHAIKKPKGFGAAVKASIIQG